MHKRGLCRRAVVEWLAECLSVCLSVTFVYCVKTVNDTATVAVECESETVPVL